jgi:hypothetical protein
VLIAQQHLQDAQALLQSGQRHLEGLRQPPQDGLVHFPWPIGRRQNLMRSERSVNIQRTFSEHSVKVNGGR